MKKCIDCKKIKPLSDFYNLPSSRDGKQSYCKNCGNIRVRAYYLKNPKRWAEDYQKKIKRHPDAMKINRERVRVWYKNLSFNKRNRIREYKHLYYLSHKEEYRNRKNLYKSKKRLELIL